MKQDNFDIIKALEEHLLDKKILNMSQNDWERFENLEAESKEAKEIVLLHKEWLGMTWKKYTKEAHKAIATTYISDKRFRMYYDKEVEGCANLLEQAVRYWVDKC